MKDNEEKQGFLKSFTGKFKKVSLDDEPDELMLKYGDIKLKGPSGQEDGAGGGIHAPSQSFFFGETKPADGQELGMTQEISGILDAIKHGRGPLAQQQKAAFEPPKEEEKSLPLGVTQEVTGILKALEEQKKDGAEEAAAAEEEPKREFSEAFERIKQQKEAEKPQQPEYGTQEIARIISEVTGEKTQMVRPVELIPEKPAPAPEEAAAQAYPAEAADEPPYEEEDRMEDTETTEELAEYDDEYEEYDEAEDWEDYAPKNTIGSKLKAFFKGFFSMPEDNSGENPFDDEPEPVEEEHTDAPLIAEQEDFSIRPELFYKTEIKGGPQEELPSGGPAEDSGESPRAEQENQDKPEEDVPKDSHAPEVPLKEEASASEKEEESAGAEDRSGEAGAKEEKAERFDESSAEETATAEETNSLPSQPPFPEGEPAVKESAEAEENAEEVAEPLADEPAPPAAENKIAKEPSKPLEEAKDAELEKKESNPEEEPAERVVPALREETQSRYEQAFGHPKPVSRTQEKQKRVIRVNPEDKKIPDAKTAARLYHGRPTAEPVAAGGEPLSEALRAEGGLYGSVIIMPAKKTDKTPEARGVSQETPGVSPAVPSKPAVQSVTISFSDLQAGRKLRNHENVRLFKARPELPVISAVAGRFGENLRAELALSRQALSQKDQAEKKAVFDALRDDGREEPRPSKKKQRKEKTKRKPFAIFSSQEEEDPEDVMPTPQPVEMVDDYTDTADAFAVKKEIFHNMKNLILRTSVLGGLTILFLLLTVAARLNLPGVPAVFIENGALYLGVALLLLAAGVLVSLPTMKNGLLSVPRLKGNSDAPVAFACVAAAVQIGVGFFNTGRFTNTDLSLYASLAMLALLLNSWGKLMIVRRVMLNFKFICSPDQKYAVKIFNDREAALTICKGVGAGEPVIAYQKKTDFLSNFLQLSYEPDPSEKFAGKISLLGGILSLLLGITSYILSKDLFAAVSAFTLSACICVPMCTMLTVNFPLLKLCKKSAKLDSMLIGYPGVRQFADTNAIVLDCNALFPENAVVLHGVKAFESRLLDKALLEAAAMLKSVDSPLFQVFEQIVSEDRLLPEVDSLSYEDERGLMGWVHGKRILVGNRVLLENHGVTPPDRSVELEHTQAGRQVTYIASAGELVAMLLTSYDFSPAMRQELQRLEDNGVSFLVATTDPNITAKLVSDRFGLFFRSVKILPAQYSKLFHEMETSPEESTRAYLATKGRVNVFSRMISACVRVRGNMTAALVVQRLTVIISFLMVAFLTIISGVAQMGALEITLYSIFWVVVTMIVAVIRKP